MILETILIIFIGIFIGTITGLTPGIHINLVALLVLSLSPKLLQYTSSINLAIFIISMAITHTFLDAIPSIYLGAPDEDQALSVLPGHKMLLKGLGYDALKLTVIGSFCSLILGLSLIPILILFVNFIDPIIKSSIGWILLILMIFMISKDKSRFWNLILFLMSGTLGLIVLNTPNIKDPLFPMLSGLFGFSVLLISLKDKVKIPKQYINKRLNIKKSIAFKAVIGATTVGFIASFLPGFGSSQAAILAQQFLRKIGDKGFLILVGGINTVNMALSLITLYALDKARNGAVVVISEMVEKFSIENLIICVGATLVTAGIVVFLSLKIAKIFSTLIEKVNYQKLILSIIVFVTILVFYFSSWIGLLILIVSTTIGLAAGLKGIGKNHCMGCLILPVIIYFL